jgi:hypothetical protein
MLASRSISTPHTRPMRPLNSRSRLSHVSPHSAHKRQVTRAGHETLSRYRALLVGTPGKDYSRLGARGGGCSDTPHGPKKQGQSSVGSPLRTVLVRPQEALSPASRARNMSLHCGCHTLTPETETRKRSQLRFRCSMWRAPRSLEPAAGPPPLVHTPLVWD